MIISPNLNLTSLGLERVARISLARLIVNVKVFQFMIFMIDGTPETLHRH